GRLPGAACPGPSAAEVVYQVRSRLSEQTTSHLIDDLAGWGAAGRTGPGGPGCLGVVGDGCGPAPGGAGPQVRLRVCEGQLCASTPSVNSQCQGSVAPEPPGRAHAGLSQPKSGAFVRSHCVL